MEKIFERTDERVIGSKSKSFKKRFAKVFRFGTKSNRSEGNEKSKNISVKSKLKSLWKRQNAQHLDECKWLLQQSCQQIYSGINESESDSKDKKNIHQKKQKEKRKEPKDTNNKNKSFSKKVGKFTLNTCRYIGMGSAPGYSFNPTSHYNYETCSYEYHQYCYGDPQSPSMFFH